MLSGLHNADEWSRWRPFSFNLIFSDLLLTLWPSIHLNKLDKNFFRLSCVTTFHLSYQFFRDFLSGRCRLFFGRVWGRWNASWRRYQKWTRGRSRVFCVSSQVIFEIFDKNNQGKNFSCVSSDFKFFPLNHLRHFGIFGRSGFVSFWPDRARLKELFKKVFESALRCAGCFSGFFESFKTGFCKFRYLFSIINLYGPYNL